MPFRHKKGDTFRLAISFSYDVTNVNFLMEIFDNTGAMVKEYTNASWTTQGARKKTLTQTPAQFDLAKGKYNLVLKHTFQDGTVRVRFDSELTIF